MTKSPLQFAKDFARLQGQLAALPSGDSQLLLALDFWQEIREHRGDAAYQSYFDEYLPLLTRLSDKGNLADLTIAELTRLRDVLAKFDSEKSEMVAAELAKVYFYVGAIEEGLAELGDSVGQNPCGFDRAGPSPPTPLPLGEVQGERVAGAPPLAVGIESVNEIAALQTICARATDTNHPLAATLNGILTEWQAAREAIDHDRARCLFVERDDSGRSVRGRLRTLVGKVDLFGKSARTDEITFDNVIKTPDDPFVGVAYSALAAVRKIFGGFTMGRNVGQYPLGFDRGDSVGREPRAPDSGEGSGSGAPPLAVGVPDGRGDRGTPSRKSKPPGFRPTRSNQASHYYHAHYAIENSGQTFTGDSIGLAFGLLAYVQLLRPEVLRLDRLLSGEVAFTGGVDTDGKLTAVNDETLGQKIERAFFSPVKYVALPEANLPAAKQHIDRLRKLYPRRNLHLIAAERLTDLIEDHNIVRSEKVCIGEFVAKRAAKYGRMTKVQVPLLVMLGYLLVCLIYPKAWVLHDGNPFGVKIDGTRIVAINRAGQSLWQYDFGVTLISGEGGWSKGNLDDDSRTEVVFMPLARDPEPFNGWLFAFDDDGDTLFTRDCSIRNVYPNDTVPYGVPLHFETVGAYVRSFKGADIIATVINDYMPARGYIRFLDRKGNQLGWYINSGGSNLQMVKDLDSDPCEDFIFFGYNNRLSCLSLFVLDPETSRGVSPPHWNKDLDLTKVEKGNAKYSIFFMPSEIHRIYGDADYQLPGPFQELVDGSFNFEVDEGQGAPIDWLPIEYRFGKDFRVTSVLMGDSFRKRVRTLIEAGQFRGMTVDDFADSIRHCVMYYIDGKLVTEGELQAQGR